MNATRPIVSTVLHADHAATRVAAPTQAAPIPRVRCCPLRKLMGDRAFTLLEVLIVIGVVGLLIALITPALSQARQSARYARELSSAQQLSVAFAAYALDFKDAALIGYPSAQQVAGPIVVKDDTGERLFNEEAQRYPWRLAPYFEYDLRGLYDNQALLKDLRVREPSYAIGSKGFRYVVSLLPSLGMNSQFVGGSELDGSFSPLTLRLLGKQHVSRIDEVFRPQRLITFASARVEALSFLPGFDRPQGYFRVRSPFGSPTQGRRWGVAYDENAPSPEVNSGFVSLRYNGKAVVTTIDGHAESLGFDDLSDMTRWSNKATSPSWTISR